MVLYHSIDIKRVHAVHMMNIEQLEQLPTTEALQANRPSPLVRL